MSFYWRGCKHTDDKPECCICLKERIEELKFYMNKAIACNNPAMPNHSLAQMDSFIKDGLVIDDELAK